MCVHPADALKIPDFPGTFIRTWDCFFFGFWYILKMLQKFHIFLGWLPVHRGFLPSGFPHTTSCRCSEFSWDIYPDTGVVFFQLFRTLHHPAAPAFLGTFTQTWELFFSGFPHTTSSSCSSFSWDIYTDMVVFFLWAFCTLHHADAPVLLGTFTQTQELFFLGVPHTTSSSCSGFAWDIYPDTGVVLFRFSGHYIMWMLRIFLGHLTGHRGCSFPVFMTLHHAYPPGFLRTFTRTLWVFFFWVFVHPADALEIPHFPGPFTQTGVVIFGISTHYIMQMLRTFLGHCFPHSTETCTSFLPVWGFFFWVFCHFSHPLLTDY